MRQRARDVAAAIRVNAVDEIHRLQYTLSVKHKQQNGEQFVKSTREQSETRAI
jgi:predicted YcjX-like family ATPase